MKRTIIAVLSLLLLFGLCACRNSNTPNVEPTPVEAPPPAVSQSDDTGTPKEMELYDPCDRSIPLEELTMDMTVDDAADLLWYTQVHTIKNGVVCQNEELFLKFCEATKNGQSAIIRIANYYEGMDPNHTSYKLYESYYDTYPFTTFSELSYDENGYNIRIWNAKKEDIITNGTYKYLLHSTSTKPNGNIASNETYFLCDLNTMTYEEIQDAAENNRVAPSIVKLRSIDQYKLPPEEYEKQEWAPYDLGYEEAMEKSTTELTLLALSDPFMIENYMSWTSDGDDIMDLVGYAMKVHPYLFEVMARDDFVSEIEQCLPVADRMEWAHVLSIAYRTYLFGNEGT